MAKERLMVRVIQALEEQFRADLALLKSWTDENGPFVDLTPQEQLRRYRDPMTRSLMEQMLRQTQGEPAVENYHNEMMRLDAAERQRMMRG